MNSLNGNYVDLIILVVLAYFVSGAFRYGFFQLLADSLSFLLSLYFSFHSYKFASNQLSINFNLPKSVSDALGFLMTTILIEAVIGTILYLGLAKLPKKYKDSKVNKILGVAPALLEGLVFVAFILSLFVSFPIKPDVKKDVLDSKIGGVIIDKTAVIEKSINNVFGGVIEDSLTYLAVEPNAKDSIDLKTSIDKLSTDTVSEKQMFDLVNDERQKAGVAKLEWAENIVPVSRDYATDMWKRSYFSHYSPEGEDVGDRLKKSGVKFIVAGENLALSPTLKIAHQGLMNSKGHRENILSSEFKKVGIGVIDNGVYGKIFVQVFTN